MAESFAEAMKRLLETPLFETPPDVEVPVDSVTVQKASAWTPVSCCVLTDATGENHCQHPPAPRPPLRQRLRWRIQARWADMRYRLGRWVAGVELNDGDDDW